MAGGVGPILMLQGKVNTNNALVVVMGTINSQPASTNVGGKQPIAMLQGVVDSSNQLLVKIV